MSAVPQWPLAQEKPDKSLGCLSSPQPLAVDSHESAATKQEITNPKSKKFSALSWLRPRDNNGTEEGTGSGVMARLVPTLAPSTHPARTSCLSHVEILVLSPQYEDDSICRIMQACLPLKASW